MYRWWLAEMYMRYIVSGWMGFVVRAGLCGVRPSMKALNSHKVRICCQRNVQRPDDGNIARLKFQLNQSCYLAVWDMAVRVADLSRRGF
jgi:hypothetical protein